MESELVSATEDFLGEIRVIVLSHRRGVSARISFLENVIELLQELRDVFVLPPDVPAPSRGAPPEVFKRLAEEQRVELMDLGEEENETQCSICIEDLPSKSHQTIIKMPGCLHLFHQDCLFEWLGRRNSCPLCRRVPYE